MTSKQGIDIQITNDRKLIGRSILILVPSSFVIAGVVRLSLSVALTIVCLIGLVLYATRGRWFVYVFGDRERISVDASSFVYRRTAFGRGPEAAYALDQVRGLRVNEEKPAVGVYGPQVPPGGWPKILFHGPSGTIAVGYGLSREDALKIIKALGEYHSQLCGDYEPTVKCDILGL